MGGFYPQAKAGLDAICTTPVIVKHDANYHYVRFADEAELRIQVLNLDFEATLSRSAGAMRRTLQV